MADSSLPASKTTTLAGSAAPSRAASIEKDKHANAPHPPSRAASTFHVQDEAEVPTKDRAPAFAVALCLFQSLAGLLFGCVLVASRTHRGGRIDGHRS